MSMTAPPTRARRVTLWRGRSGWRWKVQANNWQMIDASPHAYRSEDEARTAIDDAWPGVPLVVKP